MAPVEPQTRTHWPHCPTHLCPGPWVKAIPTSTQDPRPASHLLPRTLASAMAVAVLGVSRVKGARAVGPQGAAIGPQAERSAGQLELGVVAVNQTTQYQVDLVAPAGGSGLSASLAVAVALEVRLQLLPQGSPHSTPLPRPMQ